MIHVDALPEGWLAHLPGQLIVAADVTLLGPEEKAPDRQVLESLLDGPTLVASEVASGHATVWTDFFLGHDDTVRAAALYPSILYSADPILPVQLHIARSGTAEVSIACFCQGTWWVRVEASATKGCPLSTCHTALPLRTR